MRPDGTAGVELDMAEPMARTQQRRPFADRRDGDAIATVSRAKPDLLFDCSHGAGIRNKCHSLFLLALVDFTSLRRIDGERMADQRQARMPIVLMVPLR